MPVLRHINEDHVVPELQFLECLYRLMIAARPEPMHSERRLAAGREPWAIVFVGSPREMAGE